MKSYPVNIKPFGEQAILLEWPNTVEEKILRNILGFVECFKEKADADWEMVVAYNSVTLVSHGKPIDFEITKHQINDCLSPEETSRAKTKNWLWKIPVCYDRDFGIDLEDVSKKLGLSVEQLIQEHTSFKYIVYGIGFLPGFMYLGGLPESLEVSRRAEPRLKVMKGAVGLAGKQTGIYPQESPGGWNIIGNCPMALFNPKSENPCLVNVGDKVQFFQIGRAEYDLRKIEAEVGIYKPEKIALYG